MHVCPVSHLTEVVFVKQNLANPDNVVDGEGLIGVLVKVDGVRFG